MDMNSSLLSLPVETDCRVSWSGANNRTLVISVEGNIGSGKSTFLSFCADRGDIETYPEPVERWKNVGGENLLVTKFKGGRPCYTWHNTLKSDVDKSNISMESWEETISDAASHNAKCNALYPPQGHNDGA